MTMIGTFATPPLPVTVIGGYLGTGKTTLINRLLRQADGLRLAVLVNEFGELPIDADLIESRDENVISIAGGCVCCSYGSDLMAALIDLGKLQQAPDHLLIETSGVALPGAVAQSLQLVPGYTLDGVVVMADAETIRVRGEDQYLSDTIARQLVDADIVILNKTDLAPPGELAATRQWLGEQTPGCCVIESVAADVPLAAILGSGMERLVVGSGIMEKHHHDHAHAGHRAAVLRVARPVKPEALAERLAAPELDLVRAKGFVQGQDGQLYLLQVVGRRWEVTLAPAATSASDRIACIGYGEQLDAKAISRIISSAAAA